MDPFAPTPWHTRLTGTNTVRVPQSQQHQQPLGLQQPWVHHQPWEGSHWPKDTWAAYLGFQRAPSSAPPACPLDGSASPGILDIDDSEEVNTILPRYFPPGCVKRPASAPCKPLRDLYKRSRGLHGVLSDTPSDCTETPSTYSDTNPLPSAPGSHANDASGLPNFMPRGTPPAGAVAEATQPSSTWQPLQAQFMGPEHCLHQQQQQLLERPKEAPFLDSASSNASASSADSWPFDASTVPCLKPLALTPFPLSGVGTQPPAVPPCAPAGPALPSSGGALTNPLLTRPVSPGAVCPRTVSEGSSWGGAHLLSRTLPAEGAEISWEDCSSASTNPLPLGRETSGVPVAASEVGGGAEGVGAEGEKEAVEGGEEGAEGARPCEGAVYVDICFEPQGTPAALLRTRSLVLGSRFGTPRRQRPAPSCQSDFN